MMKELLTHSRSDCFKTCRKKHFFSYELGIRRDVDAKALRMGIAFHEGIEILGDGESIDMAVDAVRRSYATCPDGIGQYEWDIECETVVRLVCGYEWRWREFGLEYIATEKSFELPLLNPATGKPTPIWNLAGKIDGIVKLGDGRQAVKETKLLGDDISSGSDLWQRLRMDHQVSLYVDAARRLGYAVDCVLYDVARKPTIGATNVPLLDGNQCKIVLDRNGERVYNKNGSPKQTGDTASGWVVQSRPMTTEEWGEKLNNDIAERPDFYYARVEVARIDGDLEEYRNELWEIQQTIRAAQNEDRWYRTVNKNTCNFCPYFDLCSNRGFDPHGNLPEGFVKVDNVHPELNRGSDVHRGSSRSSEESSAPAAESCAAQGV